MVTAVAIKSSIAVLVWFCSLLHCSISFQPMSQAGKSHRPNFVSPLQSFDGGEKEGDWRAFRAKLVQNETNKAAHPDASWTYDSGLLIEKGSIVLSRVEDSLGCHDLRQPYFAKCVVLIVEHDTEFTQGIILNRPSNIKMDDDDIVYVDDGGDRIFSSDDTNNKWRMSFGGDLAGLYDEEPLIVCLHNHSNSELAQSISDEVLPGVYLTSHLGARSLVASGVPPESIYTFYGFCGWDPGQLEKEVKRGSWSMVSVDPQTLWEELGTLIAPGYDPRKAGLEMWRGIVAATGRKDEECREINSFQELMLKEWATQLLMVSQEDASIAEIEDSDIYRALKAAGQPSLIRSGALVRGSSLDVSPYLLQDQFLHKSTILVLQETDDASVGLVLNLPSTDSYQVELMNGTVSFPIRYGGPGGDNDEDPLIWLHSKESLKKSNVGKAFNEGDIRSIWTCTLDDVIDSIAAGLARADDFILVQGYCVWEKEQGGAGGVMGEVMAGKLEPVSRDDASAVWAQLLLQKTLSDETLLLLNFQHSIDAWNAGNESTVGNITQGNIRCVFDSNMNVATLADNALMAWAKVFLLGNAEYYR